MGHMLGQEHTPAFAEFSLEGLRSKSLPFISSFLATLAKREHQTFAAKLPSSLAAPELTELRAAIATIMLFPEESFLPDARRQHAHEINSLTYLPISILRASAGEEIEPLATSALRFGGLAAASTFKAVALLGHREASCSKPVLSAETINALLPITSDCLRDDLSRALISALLDSWLSKSTPDDCKTAQAIKKVALVNCADTFTGATLQARDCIPNILEYIPLLRHFSGPDTRVMIERLSHDSHAGIALLARACANLATANPYQDLEALLLCDDPIPSTLDAFHVFAYRLSDEADKHLADIFARYTQRLQLLPPGSPAQQETIATIHLALLQSLKRRALTEPAHSQLLSTLFQESAESNYSAKLLALSLVKSLAVASPMAPLALYDDSESLNHITGLIRFLQRQDKQMGDEAAAGLLVDTPACYGFQLNPRTQGLSSQT
jgi:hypothetical protein